MKKRPVVFLDRDGTILNERGYLDDPKRLFFYAQAFSALRKLKRAGYALVIITNQSGVGRGYFTLKRLAEVHAAFRSKLQKAGVRLDGIYFCPHLPDAGCSCRKPQPGLPRRAARDLNLDLKRAFMVGDQKRDIELGKRIGAEPILVLTGAGRSQKKEVRRMKARITSHVGTAASYILSVSSRER